MPVATRRFDSVEAFLDVCGSFLEAREPEHQLTLGILGDALARRDFPEDGALVAALAGGRVVATAIWTPPWNVILSEVDDEHAIHAVADSLAGTTWVASMVHRSTRSRWRAPSHRSGCPDARFSTFT